MEELIMHDTDEARGRIIAGTTLPSGEHVLVYARHGTKTQELADLIRGAAAKAIERGAAQANSHTVRCIFHVDRKHLGHGAVETAWPCTA